MDPWIFYKTVCTGSITRRTMLSLFQTAVWNATFLPINIRSPIVFPRRPEHVLPLIEQILYLYKAPTSITTIDATPLVGLWRWRSKHQWLPMCGWIMRPFSNRKSFD
jgi:hypothetical protein